MAYLADERMGEFQPGVIPTAEKFHEFLLGGNAYFTVRKTGTDVRFTYHVARWKKRPTWYFVGVLTAPDLYSDLGLIQLFPNADNKSAGMSWSRGRTGRFSEKAPSYIMFSSLLDMLAKEQEIPEGIEIWHEGRCCVCARRLTVPESIAAGIGPECAGKAAASIIDDFGKGFSL